MFQCPAILGRLARLSGDCERQVRREADELCAATDLELDLALFRFPDRVGPMDDYQPGDDLRVPGQRLRSVRRPLLR